MRSAGVPEIRSAEQLLFLGISWNPAPRHSETSDVIEFRTSVIPPRARKVRAP